MTQEHNFIGVDMARPGSEKMKLTMQTITASRSFDLPEHWPDHTMYDLRICPLSDDKVVVAHPDFPPQIYDFKTGKYEIVRMCDDGNFHRLKD